jgi:thymidylate synthase (FAD)
MKTYEAIAQETDNDTAGYAAPQGLRNILIMQANHEAWMHFIRLRSCNRNTNETQYVTFRIWEELLKTVNGEDFFRYAGPDCMFGACKEGKMTCGSPLRKLEREARALGIATPRHIINTQWPLLQEV